MSNPVEQGRAFWDDHARRDPLWAILSDPSKSGRRWTLPQFLETGRREISLLMYQLRALGIDVERGAALDFGCGVGRLSQPLADYFDSVTGVDISPEMIRLANDINADPDRVHYVCNRRDDLSILSSGAFSFMYSNVVLQHIQPALAVRYLADLFRVVGPRGVLVFQLPSHPRPAEGDSGPRPMADSAYRAALRIEGEVRRDFTPGEAMVLAVSITNASAVEWVQQQSGAIRAGNHWLDAAGARMLIQDDGRATLPARLGPGERCRVTVNATAPADSGRYQLELDVVHEGISWFADKGSPTARTVIQVGAADGAVAGAASTPARLPDRLRLPEYAEAPDAGALPMHGVPRGEIEALIGRSGARLVHVELDERSGREWVGYRYFARKL